MNTSNLSLSENYFNNVYRENNDPWNFESSTYEKDKYIATIQALPNKVYHNAFEIGCSIGVLSQMFAEKCEKLLAVDVANAPLIKARERLKDIPQVILKKMTVPNEFPDETFDLVLMSEVGYYLSLPDFKHLQQLITNHLEPNGQVLLIHWTPFVKDNLLTGDKVHDTWMELCGGGKPFRHLLNRRKDTYRLDLFEKI